MEDETQEAYNEWNGEARLEYPMSNLSASTGVCELFPPRCFMSEYSNFDIFMEFA